MYPNLFSIGPLTIHTYGLFLALAFLLGLRVAIYFGKRDGIDPSFITDLVVFIFVSALVGAKLLLIAVDFDYYSKDWHRLLTIYQVGGVYYGGFLLALLVSIWYIRRRKLQFWKTTDALVMGIAFGQIMGRMGCFFAGCCWGTEAPAGFPLAVVFTNPFAAEQVGTPLDVPLHPAQLYEAIPMILVFVLLVFSFARRKFHGQQLCVYLLLYSIIRFLVEFYRGDPRGHIGPLSTSQFFSLFAFAGGILIYALRRRVPRDSTAVTTA